MNMGGEFATERSQAVLHFGRFCWVNHAEDEPIRF